MTNNGEEHEIWNWLVWNWEIPYLEKVDPRHDREGDLKLEEARLKKHLCPAFTCSKWSRASRCGAENFRDIGSTSWPSGSGSWGFISAKLVDPNLQEGGWSRVQTRRCPARHCTKIFTLPATETISSKPAQLARTLMSSSLSIFLAWRLKIQPKGTHGRVNHTWR